MSDFWDFLGENVRSHKSDKIPSVFSHVGKGAEENNKKKKNKKEKKKEEEEEKHDALRVAAAEQQRQLQKKRGLGGHWPSGHASPIAKLI